MIRRSLVALFSAAGLLVACGDSGSSTGGGDQGGSDEGGSNTGAGNTGGENVGAGPQGGSGDGGSAPDDCGNGEVDGGEDCDGANLDGNSCGDIGFVDGTLACNADCTYDTSGCTEAACGDGSINGKEDCDGTLLGGETCESQNFDAGTLACSGKCAFDTTGCVNFSCGDMVINGTEECDGTDLGTADCASEGFSGGTLACAANCAFDTAGCFACGDGNVDAGEECDDGNVVDGDGCSAICEEEGPPAGWTCNDDYYDDGGYCDCSCGAHDPDCDLPGLPVWCGGSSAPAGTTCVADVCVPPPNMCGNGVVNAGEQCDDGNLISGDGCSATCQDDAPVGWTCNVSYYNALDGCDCSCGVHDPDCDAPGQTLYCGGSLAPAGTTCVNNICVPPGGPVCGNGTVEGTEQCDDGNTTNGDGCSSTCQDEGPPASWACNALYYDDGTYCDCSCGAHDPDCDIAGAPVWCDEVEGAPGTTCVADVCVGGGGPPAGWSCNPNYWDALDGCDCDCNGHDPDCDVPGQTLYCDESIPPAGTVCIADACVP